MLHHWNPLAMDKYAYNYNYYYYVKLLTVNFLYRLGRLNLIFTHFNGGRTYLLGTPLGAVA